MKKVIILFILFTVSVQFINAQGRFKIRKDQYIQIGYEKPTNTSLTFGQVRPYNSQYNNGAWAIEDYTIYRGLNFWKPWPNQQPNDLSVTSNFRLFLNDRGKVGINMNPIFSNTLQVNGSIQTYTISYSSDERLKKDIESVKNALNSVLKMKAVSYEYNAGMEIIKYKDFINVDEDDLEMLDEKKRELYETEALTIPLDLKGQKRFGYIAQDLEEILPEVV